MRKSIQSTKRLPAFMDGDTEILPPVALPLPSGGTRMIKGRNTWATTASAILIPRWAAECIRAELVFGQELREGETLKERVEAIQRSQGEMDKWRRILDWALRLCFHLDARARRKWHGSFRELADLLPKKPKGFDQRDFLRNWAFSHGWNDYPTATYWDAWVRASWQMVRDCLKQEANDGAMDDSNRTRTARLLAEGLSYWSYPLIPNDHPKIIRGILYWEDTGDIARAKECLGELLRPPSERKRDRADIVADFADSLASIRHYAGKTEARTWGYLREEYKQAEATAAVADAEARAADAEAGMHAARKESAEYLKDAIAARASEKAEAAARARAEEERRKEAKARRELEAGKAAAEALAEERGRMLAEHFENSPRREDVRNAEENLRHEMRNLGKQVAATIKHWRKQDSDKALVEAFTDMEKARAQDAADAEKFHRAPRGKAEIASSVIAKAELHIGTSRFLRLYDGDDKHTPNWFALGKPQTGEEYGTRKAAAQKERQAKG